MMELLITLLISISSGMELYPSDNDGPMACLIPTDVLTRNILWGLGFIQLLLLSRCNHWWHDMADSVRNTKFSIDGHWDMDAIGREGLQHEDNPFKEDIHQFFKIHQCDEYYVDALFNSRARHIKSPFTRLDDLAIKYPTRYRSILRLVLEYCTFDDHLTLSHHTLHHALNQLARVDNTVLISEEELIEFLVSEPLLDLPALKTVILKRDCLPNSTFLHLLEQSRLDESTLQVESYAHADSNAIALAIRLMNEHNFEIVGELITRNPKSFNYKCMACIVKFHGDSNVAFNLLEKIAWTDEKKRKKMQIAITLISCLERIPSQSLFHVFGFDESFDMQTLDSDQSATVIITALLKGKSSEQLLEIMAQLPNLAFNAGNLHNAAIYMFFLSCPEYVYLKYLECPIKETFDVNYPELSALFFHNCIETAKMEGRQTPGWSVQTCFKTFERLASVGADTFPSLFFLLLCWTVPSYKFFQDLAGLSVSHGLITEHDIQTILQNSFRMSKTYDKRCVAFAASALIYLGKDVRVDYVRNFKKYSLMLADLFDAEALENYLNGLNDKTGTMATLAQDALKNLLN